MELIRDLIYYALPILVSLYFCGKLYPKLNPPEQKGRIGVIYLLACMGVVAAVFMLNAFIWVTIGFIAIMA